MAITFPRPMPEAGAARQTFELGRRDFLSPETGGRVGSIAVGPPVWVAEWSLGQGGPRRADEWVAFVDSLEGSKRLFVGRDLSRPYPLAYQDTALAGLTRAAGGAFNGAASAWSIDTDDDGAPILVLSGLPAFFRLSRRDYVGFRWTTEGVERRALVRLAKDYTGTGEGWGLLPIQPAVPSIVPPTATAHFDLPGCLMRLIPDKTVIGAMDRRLAPAVTVAAIQDLLP
ncbi:hypothetical protein J2X45_003404 [Caulobacter sp. BE264]|uniref:hypothetical protein n=1 Tax=Caulobacter sp. BE264 TaxID=2817724 RepID=UPI00285BEEE1|nr:hypothetical protein [Caulobacter sp. BE264]MDR7232298.1 hypothetical protein [Caulobacter sp. BE264]